MDQFVGVEYFLLCEILLQQVGHIELEVAQLASRRVQIDPLLLILKHNFAENCAILIQFGLLIHNELL